MEHSSNSPHLAPDLIPTPLVGPPRIRHDGWTPERMATFLEVLADTGIVCEAARRAGMHRDSAYSLQNRDPVFAAAWRAAQSHARPQIADGLLERSITGTIEHYYRDGVLVGERRHYESWLGLAVLKRLDKQAEEDRAGASLSALMTADWAATIEAVRAGGTAAVAQALESNKADTPPSPRSRDDPWDDVWRDDEGRWMTIHAPPPDFDGWESCPWDGFNAYQRACTAEEAELLDAHEAAMIEQERREIAQIAEKQRDDFFAKLRSDMSAASLRHPELVSGSIISTAADFIEMDAETSSA